MGARDRETAAEPVTGELMSWSIRRRLGATPVSSPTERVAAVLFGLNLTLAALMLYRMLGHAGSTSDVAADDLAEEELQTFATQRRSALLLQASATVRGAFLPLIAVAFYLALAIFYVIDPVRLMRTSSLRRARLAAKSAED